jgi:hypothetical protein
MPTESRVDSVFGAIAVSVLLIGTATGNAYAMLGMSVAALVGMMVFARRRLVKGGLFPALVAAVIAALVAIALTTW